MALLAFLDREEERRRLRRVLDTPHPTFAVLYGRRRCGKSRLLREVLPTDRTVYAVADARESTLQRLALAREMARLRPEFGRVSYPDWDVLLERWWESAPPGTVLAIDEFPTLVASAPEIPSLLQKRLDSAHSGSPHLIIAGSSQRMMQGLVLDRSAPLFGRATEILKIAPLTCGWIKEAFALKDDATAVESFAIWGGIPRYWELAADYSTLEEAVRSLILSPLGVLHDEPAGLLLEDLRDVTQAASILALIGQGCHRLSEIAGRLGKPATSLSRPMERLLELGIVRRDLPFGTSIRDTKRTAYRIADPFLRFWFRYVEPNRSRLEGQQIDSVWREIRRTFPQFVGTVWEDLVRESVPRTEYGGLRWRPARSWWGPGLNQKPMEVDLVAESEDGEALLVGEVKWTSAPPHFALLRQKAENLSFTRGRRVFLGLWSKMQTPRMRGSELVFGPEQVVPALK